MRQAALTALQNARQAGDGELALLIAKYLELFEARLLEIYPGLF